MQSSGNKWSDRFIPYRSRRSIETATYLIKKESCDLEVKQNIITRQIYVNPALEKWKKTQYVNMLSKITHISNNKILNIPRALDFDIKEEKNTFNHTWPVSARSRPLIESPVTILDLPDFDGRICNHVVHWGSKEFLAFLCNNEVHICHANKKEDCVITDTRKRVRNCVRWNTSATKLAVGLIHGAFSIIDCIKNVTIRESICTCSRFCNVTAIEWSFNEYLITGCSKGKLSQWNASLQCLCSYVAHDGGIITIALSSNEKYLASSGIDAKVRIWLWPSMTANFQVECFSNIRGIAWHPWKESLFAIGGSVGEGTITLWSAANHQQVEQIPTSNRSFVDDLTWNCITGELVVSYWHPEECNNPFNPYSRGQNSIVVLSGANREVDRIEWHAGNVMYLLWGMNGTQLGTGGTDEMFCIWDFFGSSKEKDKKIKLYKRRNEKIASTSTTLFNSVMFGRTIR